MVKTTETIEEGTVKSLLYRVNERCKELDSMGMDVTCVQFIDRRICAITYEARRPRSG